MTFSDPRGLWLLSGIALLLLYYIWRPKYTSLAVSNQFLWKRSAKYQEKHLVSARLRKLLILAMQIAMIVLLACLAAKLLVPAGTGGVDYVIILDQSASMRMKTDTGETSFDRAKTAIAALADAMGGQDTMSVLLTDDTGSTLIERTASGDSVRQALSAAKCSYGTGDPTSAVMMVEEIARLRPHTQVYFYTDHDFSQTGNITVMNINNQRPWNVTITGTEEQVFANGRGFQTRLISCAQSCQVPLGLYVDGVLTDAQMVSCAADEDVSVSWFVEGLSQYERVRVSADVDDALAEDNEDYYFPQASETANILLAGQNTFYLQKVLMAFPSLNVQNEPTARNAPNSDFDIYIYDCCLPPALPTDGAIWLINPDAVPEGMDYTLGKIVPGGTLTRNGRLDEQRMLTLQNQLINRDTVVLQLRDCTSIGSNRAVLNVGKYEAMIAGYGGNGMPHVIFLFDLHESNLPLQSDYVALVRNMLAFSLPSMLDTPYFDTGVNATAYALPMCTDMYLLDAQEGFMDLPYEAGMEQLDFSVPKPGLYSLMQPMENSGMRYCSFFARVPLSECGAEQLSGSVPALWSGQSTFEADCEVSAQESRSEIPEILAAILLLLLIMEWAVFTRERI